jgi:hypothetical protein
MALRRKTCGHRHSGRVGPLQRGANSAMLSWRQLSCGDHVQHACHLQALAGSERE